MNQVSKGFGAYYQQQLDQLDGKIAALTIEIHKLKTIELPKTNERISNQNLIMALGCLVLAIIFCIVLSGCGGTSIDNNSGGQSLSIQLKIINWQNREKEINQAIDYRTTEPTGDLFEDICFIVKRLPYIQYKSDGENADNWQTSQETINRKEGDCEDMSILVYIILLDSGILEYYNADIFLRWITYNDGVSKPHVYCIVKAESGAVVCISNMWVYENDFGDYNIVTDFDLYSIYPGGVQL